MCASLGLQLLSLRFTRPFRLASRQQRTGKKCGSQQQACPACPWSSGVPAASPARPASHAARPDCLTMPTCPAACRALAFPSYTAHHPSPFRHSTLRCSLYRTKSETDKPQNDRIRQILRFYIIRRARMPRFLASCLRIGAMEMAGLRIISECPLQYRPAAAP